MFMMMMMMTMMMMTSIQLRVCGEMFDSDVDACDENNGGCSPFAHCIDNEGKANCTCVEGSFGDGFSCSGIRRDHALVIVGLCVQGIYILTVHYNQFWTSPGSRMCSPKFGQLIQRKKLFKMLLPGVEF